MDITQALKTEITTDPLGLGYTGKSTDLQAALINDSTKDRPVVVHEIGALALIGALDLSELGTNTPNSLMLWFIGIFAQAVAVNPTDPTDPHFTGVRDAIFPVATYPQTHAALVALTTRNGSRAEELFGEGTYVEPDQITNALAT